MNQWHLCVSHFPLCLSHHSMLGAGGEERQMERHCIQGAVVKELHPKNPISTRARFRWWDSGLWDDILTEWDIWGPSEEGASACGKDRNHWGVWGCGTSFPRPVFIGSCGLLLHCTWVDLYDQYRTGEALLSHLWDCGFCLGCCLTAWDHCSRESMLWAALWRGLCGLWSFCGQPPDEPEADSTSKLQMAATPADTGTTTSSEILNQNHPSKLFLNSWP